MDSASRGVNGDNRDQARATVAFVQVGQGGDLSGNPKSSFLSRCVSMFNSFLPVVKNLAVVYT